MEYLILIAIIGGISFFLYYLGKKHGVFSELKEENDNRKDADEECCGAHEVCETDLLRMMSQEIIYFEDEELDNFKGMSADAYNEEKLEEFRDVFYTLKKNEINDWLHSLELREIEFPIALKQELISILN